MTEPGRKVPIQIMNDVLKTTKGLPDPRGSSALMHYSPMWKNGKLYNLEILYNQQTNSRSILDNTPRNIDIFKGPLDVTKPHIIINPRP